MKSYTIHLIRHGICEGNLEGRYIGRTQSPLAQEGIQALLELKRKGIYPEAKKYYASPCVRCVDTLKSRRIEKRPEVRRLDERWPARGPAERRKQHRIYAACLCGL